MILRLQVAKVYIAYLSRSVKPPRWLEFGFAANEAGYSFGHLPPVIPTLEQLESQDTKEFGRIGGFQWSYLFVSYIETKYGKNKILQLLRNSDQFEKIIGLSKDQLYQQWREFAGL